MSETVTNPIAELAKAYTSAYAEMDHVVKNAANTHFRSNYADLSAVLDTVRPVFAKHGLAFLQTAGKVTDVGGKLVVAIVGMLMHSSGQTLTTELQVPLGDKVTAQAMGSAITYGRRYQLAAVGGVAQVDDDGNAASSREERSSSRRAAVEESVPETSADDIRKAIDAAVEAKSKEALELLKESVEATGDEALIEEFLEARKLLKPKRGK